MFSGKFCEISKNTFFAEHLRTTASDLWNTVKRKCLDGFWPEFALLWKVTKVIANFSDVNKLKYCDFGQLCAASLLHGSFTAQKMKFSIKDFFSKCDQIRRKLRIWSHLLKKSLMENFVFCLVITELYIGIAVIFWDIARRYIFAKSLVGANQQVKSSKKIFYIRPD